jgi:glycosyltransferase involved in cell wall biosynthesis
LLSPKTSEEFFSPLKLYEALALGIPVLTTPLAAFSAQRETGLVATAPGTDPEALAEGVIRLAEDKEKALSLREKGLEAAKNATWRARAERILAFCESLR